MNEPGPVDLSPLDPQADAERWSLLVDATRLRVAAVLRARELDPFVVVSGWSRPILAAAAALLLLLSVAVAALGGSRTIGPSEARRLAYLAESSVLHGHAATGAEVMGAIRPRAGRW
jgi:hypothetical protein